MNRKLLFLLLACFVSEVFAVDQAWDPNVTYIIPDDGLTYVFDGTISLTDDLLIEGVLEIRDSDVLQIDAGTVDGTNGVDGTPGSVGGNIQIQNNGTLTVKSGGTLYLKAGDGGSGGNATDPVPASIGDEMNGGNGGDGGGVLINNPGTVNVESGGIFRMQGGDGGDGGDGLGIGFSDCEPGGVTVIVPLLGGGGGKGGRAQWSNSGEIVLADLLALDLIGGGGGNGGDDGILFSVGIGGQGGNGGDVELDGVLTVKGDETALEISTGGGGSNGDGGVYGGKGGGGHGVTGIFTIKATGEDTFTYCDPVITLSQTLDIDFTWTITRDKTIFGNGNQIRLGPNGAIVLDGTVNGGGVTVLFDSLEIEGIDDHDVRCIDDDSTIELRDVRLNLDTDYTFTKGAIKIMGNCIVDGTLTTFLYQSTQPFTIDASSELRFVPKSIFEYDTTPNNLIQMVAGTSILYLDNATLLATRPLTLTTGVLSTEGLGIVRGVGLLSLGGLSDIIVRGGLARVGNVTL